MLVRGIDEWHALVGKQVSFELLEPWEPDLWLYEGQLDDVIPVCDVVGPTGDFYVEGDWGGRLILADETVRVTVEGE